MATQETTELLVAFPEGNYANLIDWLHFLQNNIAIALRSWQGFNPRCVIDNQQYSYRAARQDGFNTPGYHFGVTILYHKVSEEPAVSKPALPMDSVTLQATADLLRTMVKDLEQKIAAENP